MPAKESMKIFEGFADFLYPVHPVGDFVEKHYKYINKEAIAGFEKVEMKKHRAVQKNVPADETGRTGTERMCTDTVQY